MRVFFRCKRSGNLVSFTNENDIAGLRKHEGYEEVTNAVQEAQTPSPSEEVKKRGRHPKEPKNDVVI